MNYKDILSALNLREQFSANLDISRYDFVTHLWNIIKEKPDNPFADIRGGFLNNHKFEGWADPEGFIIERDASFFSNIPNKIKAIGTFQDKKDGHLLINTETIGVYGYSIISFLLPLIIAIAVLISMIITKKTMEDIAPYLFLFVFLGMFILLPYFKIRKVMKGLRIDLENEFSKFTKKHS